MTENSPLTGPAKASYYADLEVRKNASDDLFDDEDAQTLAMLIPTFESFIKAGHHSPRHVRFDLGRLHLFFRQGPFPLLFPHPPLFWILFRMTFPLVVSFEDFGPVHDRVVAAELRGTTIERVVPDIPPRLEVLKVCVESAPPWESFSQTLAFPSTLSHLELRGEWVPLANWGILPASLRSLVVGRNGSFTVDAFNSLALSGLRLLRLDSLPALTRLDNRLHLPAQLEELEVCGSFLLAVSRENLPFSLKRLTVNCSHLSDLTIGAFPPSLESMTLTHCILPSLQIDALRFPPLLKSLTVSFGRLTTMKFLEGLPATLEHLSLRENQIGNLGPQKKHSKRTAIDTDTPNQKAAHTLLFPAGLKRLDLAYNRDFFSHFKNQDMVLPLGLLVLNLSATGLRTWAGLALPLLLQELYLHTNTLTTLSIPLPLPTWEKPLCASSGAGEHCSLPIALRKISLESNALETVDLGLPVTCKEFTVSGNPLRLIRIVNANDPSLSLTRMVLYEARITSLHDCLLPVTLTSLKVQSPVLSSITGFRFLPLLRELDVSGCVIETLAGAVFPALLTLLIADGNRIHSLRDVVFPASLIHLSLGANQLASLKDVILPPRLQRVYLDQNRLREADYVFPNSMRVVCISDQEPGLKGVRTVLPPRLQYLDLGGNELDEPAMAMVVFPRTLKSLRLDRNTFGDYDAFRTRLETVYPWISMDDNADDDDFTINDGNNEIGADSFV